MQELSALGAAAVMIVLPASPGDREDRLPQASRGELPDAGACE